MKIAVSPSDVLSVLVPGVGINGVGGWAAMIPSEAFSQSQPIISIVENKTALWGFAGPTATNFCSVSWLRKGWKSPSSKNLEKCMLLKKTPENNV